jgi:hypothetical protein
MFEERLGAVDSKLLILKQSRGSQHAPAVGVETALRAVRWLCANLRRVWTDFPRERRAILERFILPEGVYVDHAGDIRTTKLGLIFALSYQMPNQSSPKVDLRFDSSNFCMDYFSDLAELHSQLEVSTHSTAKAA